MVIRIVNYRDLKIKISKLRCIDLNIENKIRIVRNIINDIRINGLNGLIKWSLKLDGFKPELYYSEDFEKAWKRLPANLRRSLGAMADRIKIFHEAQLPPDTEVYIGGIKLRLTWRPLSSVGIYVPGGKHPYISTMLMGGIPAAVAGVKRIVAACPFRDEHRDLILGTAYIARISELLRCGGAQAIAALAWGVMVKRVDKIVGPGSIYVQLAKLEVFRHCGIDFYAGPTELVVITDGSRDPKRIALDMLAQAEHGKSSIIVLLDTDKKHLETVYKIYSKGYREEFAETFFVHIDTLDDAVEFVNEFAPEHLLLAVEDLAKILDNITNTSLISVDTPPALSDYAAGSNHILPTSGWSKFKGVLTVYEFLKPIIHVNGLDIDAIKISKEVAILEGMKYHKKSIESI